MAQRGIREYDAKRMMAEVIKIYDNSFSYDGKVALVTPETKMDDLIKNAAWLKTDKLVVKPDQLFGKRGKHGLLCLNASWGDASKWISERMNKETKVGETSGKLTHFLIEPFTPHKETEEYYVAIKSGRDGDTIYFSTQGGIFVEENWDKVKSVEIPILTDAANIQIGSLVADAGEKREIVEKFIKNLYRFYVDGGFAYLEINPFTFSGNNIVPLDMVAKVDDTAAFKCTKIWKNLEFPASFGTSYKPEEKYIKELDEKSGSSLKLTILNPKGRIWTMVAGGGASVIYADTICDLGFAKDMANYGEYSGNPTTDETYEYAKTMLDLMTREKDSKGKVLLIGGGIANFTDVAKTFTGIIKALTEYKQKLIDNKIRIYVRRGGPNYKEGLMKMKKLGDSLGVPIEVYGPDTHMTKIVSLAIKTLQ